MVKLVLVLGDQLTPTLASLRSADKANDRVVMAEVTSEASYVPHHPKKIALVFACMRKFAQQLRDDGWAVDYTRLDDPEDVIVSTQGRPISPDDEIRVVDDGDRDVTPGGTGHLLTRGPYTIRAYHAAPEANAKSFTSEGFYRTGDIVRRRESGHLEVLGRASDHINRAGEKISAEEIEDHLIAHPDVLDAVVVSVPDPRHGERTCAFVLPREGAAPEARVLRGFMRGRDIAAFKIPDEIRLVSDLGTTAVGKISRRELRAQLQAQASETEAT